MSFWRPPLNAILSVLLAPPCAACGRVLDHPLEGAVCDLCWSSIFCDRSAFSLDVVTRCQSIGPYEGTLRAVVHALKYDARRSVAAPLARMMVEQACGLLTEAHCVVPVPLHPWRERQRGFNQAEDLARGLGLPIVRALRRTRMTRPQVELPAAERAANVKDAFALRSAGIRPFAVSQDAPLLQHVIVLVDDVATTGATLDACARVLTQAGAREVRALTAARVVTARR